MNSNSTQSQETAALDQLNSISEEMIRESYLAGSCRSIWVLGLDDGLN
jgi:hypothetical protein